MATFFESPLNKFSYRSLLCCISFFLLYFFFFLNNISLVGLHVYAALESMRVLVPVYDHNT